MGVVLDPGGAELLARAVVERYDPGALVTAVVVSSAGKQIAMQTSCKEREIARVLHARQVAEMALERCEDVVETPQIWVEAHANAEVTAPAPGLTAVALHFYYSDEAGRLAGVIALIGGYPEQMIETLTGAITTHGFLLSSDLPQVGAQG